MAYCSVGNVTNGFKRIPLDDDSHPSMDEVTTFCDEISLEMDAQIQTKGISVPVTGTDAVKVLRDTALNGVIAKMLRAVDMEVDAAKMYQQLYDSKMKKMIENPEMLSAEVSDTGVGSAADTYDRKFKMGEREW